MNENSTSISSNEFQSQDPNVHDNSNPSLTCPFNDISRDETVEWDNVQNGIERSFSFEDDFVASSRNSTQLFVPLQDIQELPGEVQINALASHHMGLFINADNQQIPHAMNISQTATEEHKINSPMQHFYFHKSSSSSSSIINPALQNTVLSNDSTGTSGSDNSTASGGTIPINLFSSLSLSDKRDGTVLLTDMSPALPMQQVNADIPPQPHHNQSDHVQHNDALPSTMLTCLSTEKPQLSCQGRATTNLLGNVSLKTMHSTSVKERPASMHLRPLSIHNQSSLDDEYQLDSKSDEEKETDTEVIAVDPNILHELMPPYCTRDVKNLALKPWLDHNSASQLISMSYRSVLDDLKTSFYSRGSCPAQVLLNTIGENKIELQNFNLQTIASDNYDVSCADKLLYLQDHGFDEQQSRAILHANEVPPSWAVTTGLNRFVDWSVCSSPDDNQSTLSPVQKGSLSHAATPVVSINCYHFGLDESDGVMSGNKYATAPWKLLSMSDELACIVGDNQAQQSERDATTDFTAHHCSAPPSTPLPSPIRSSMPQKASLLVSTDSPPHVSPTPLRTTDDTMITDTCRHEINTVTSTLPRDGIDAGARTSNSLVIEVSSMSPPQLHDECKSATASTKKRNQQYFVLGTRRTILQSPLLRIPNDERAVWEQLSHNLSKSHLSNTASDSTPVGITVAAGRHYSTFSPSLVEGQHLRTTDSDEVSPGDIQLIRQLAAHGVPLSNAVSTVLATRHRADHSPAIQSHFERVTISPPVSKQSSMASEVTRDPEQQRLLQHSSVPSNTSTTKNNTGTGNSVLDHVRSFFNVSRASSRRRSI